MKYLIVVRHGECGDIDHLNEQGRQDILRLSGTLKKYAEPGSRILLLTSARHRAQESAEILGQGFGVKPKVENALTVDPETPVDCKHLLNRIWARTDEEEYDIVILVTHAPCTQDFPTYYAKQVLKTEIESSPLLRGWANVIDCEHKTLKRIT